MRIDEYTIPNRKSRFGNEPQDIYKTTDARRPGLTLKHLNKLRKTRRLRDIENEHRRLFLPCIYGEEKEEERCNKDDEAGLDASKPALKSIEDRSKQQRKVSKAAMRKLKEKFPRFS